jgi:type IV pilus assembly protein PilM
MPCALDDVLMDFHRARDGNTIMLAAMRKDIAGRRTDLLRRCRLTPDVLDLDALALRRSTVAVYDGRHLPADSRVVIVDIGAASVRLHALQGVHIVYSREQLISGLQDLSPENVRWRLVQEIRRALQLFQASFSCGVWAKVILAGGYAAVAGLDAELSELTGVHVALADPFANMLIRPGLDLRELAGLKTILAQACGLAMSQVY